MRLYDNKTSKEDSNESIGQQSKLKLLKEFNKNDEVIEPKIAEVSKDFQRYTQKSQVQESSSKITQQKQDSITPGHGSLTVNVTGDMNITGDIKNIKDVDSDFNLASASLTQLGNSQLGRNVAADITTSQNTSNVGSQLFVNHKLEVQKNIEKNYKPHKIHSNIRR